MQVARKWFKTMCLEGQGNKKWTIEFWFTIGASKVYPKVSNCIHGN